MVVDFERRFTLNGRATLLSDHFAALYNWD